MEPNDNYPLSEDDERKEDEVENPVIPCKEEQKELEKGELNGEGGKYTGTCSQPS